MKIEILNRNLPGSRETSRRIEEKVRRVVRRLSHEVSRITVQVQALAGRAGNGSRECLVLVRLRDGGEVVVRKRGEGVMDLVFHALRQARTGTLRRLSRRRGR